MIFYRLSDFLCTSYDSSIVIFRRCPVEGVVSIIVATAGAGYVFLRSSRVEYYFSYVGGFYFTSFGGSYGKVYVDYSSTRSLGMIRYCALAKGGCASVSYCFSRRLTILCFISIFAMGFYLYVYVWRFGCSTMGFRSNGCAILLASRFCFAFCVIFRG